VLAAARTTLCALRLCPPAARVTSKQLHINNF
jgi:hypothetical protein